MAVVVDASALLELLLGTETGSQVRRALRDAETVAPAHLDAEVLSALGRLAREDRLPPGAVRVRLRALARAPIGRFAFAPLLEDAWAMRENVAMRDALYVALARRLDASLLTADGALSRAPGLGVPVTFVGA